MKTINQYLDAACLRMDFTSDRALARTMERSHSAVNKWRNGRALPDDEAMTLLADLAGENQAEALLMLNYWRSEGDSKKLYELLLKKLGAVLALVLCVFSGIQSADAGTIRAHTTAVYPEIYIITQLRLLLRRWKNRLNPCFN